MHEPIKANGFPGFFKIPGHSRYVINEEGVVLEVDSGEMIKSWRGPNGYFNIRLIDDEDNAPLWGRHRLLAFVFKHPGVPIKKLVVNHINAIKGDDRLDNLEWVTYKGNLHHASRMGLDVSCIPISVRDVDTGEVVDYPSINEYAQQVGFSKDAVIYRIKVGETRVFPERKQYRSAKTVTPWIVPEDVEKALMINSTSKVIYLRYVLTNEVMKFEQLTKLANHLDVPLPTLSQWAGIPDQPVLPGFIQLKWGTDNAPWRSVEDPYLEHERFTGKRAVKVTNVKNGATRVYASAVECAKEHCLKPTALNYRLKSNGETVFPDGFTYEYYRKRPTLNTKGPTI